MAEPMLFGAPTCTVCGKEMEPSGTGRPRKYCSKACSSKGDRMREKEKRAQALAAATENPRGETPLPVGDGEGAELLEFGEALRQHDARFLLQLERAEREGDGVLACQALDDLIRAVDGLVVRHREVAERMLAAHPAQAAAPEGPASEPLVSPRGETRGPLGDAQDPVPAAATAPAVATGVPVFEDRSAPAAPRGETPPPSDPARDRPQALLAPVPPRGETVPSALPAAAGPVPPRGGTPPGGERLRELVGQRLAQQGEHRPAPVPSASQRPPVEVEVPVPADPMHRRLPPSDARIVLDPKLFGDWWALAGWTVNPDVYLVTGEGHQVGWVERGLPGIGDRWVAVCENYFIGDPITQEATLHDTPEQAAFTVHTAYLQNL
ncbi:hypothetical protein ACFVXG_38120 [Kitasatospora sp. NPDC058162]|uniref:hypothetical protein n=1 Tax=Kitasatospora sp. NPDC058162 TaxID=3346362 RepID=UPI0036D99DFA